MSHRPDASPPAVQTLNPAHARAIRATFKHVSELLEQAARVARGDVGPFDRQRPDVSREEADRLAALVEEIQARMIRVLERLGIAGPEPETSARWSIRTALLFSDIALSELSPEALRAYGALGEAEGAAIDAAARELRQLVGHAMHAARDPTPPPKPVPPPESAGEA
jgi:hypothetical protein